MQRRTQNPNSTTGGGGGGGGGGFDNRIKVIQKHPHGGNNSSSTNNGYESSSSLGTASVLSSTTTITTPTPTTTTMSSGNIHPKKGGSSPSGTKIGGGGFGGGGFGGGGTTTGGKTHRTVRLVGIVVLIGICIIGLWNTISNSSSSRSTSSQLQGGGGSLASTNDIEEIKQLHDTYGEHHAVHPKEEHMEPFRTTKDGRSVPNYKLQDLMEVFEEEERTFLTKPVSRGVSGRPLVDTPVMQYGGARRGHISCDITVDSLAYWNEYLPINKKSYEPDNNSTIVTTFHVPDANDDGEEYYISFSPDSGGWNNIRMSMEIMFVLAAATGRTLVLPPKEPLYLLHHDTDERHKGFADFFPLTTDSFQSQVKIISFAEFFARTRDNSNNFVTVSDNELLNKINASSEHCDKRDASPSSCKYVYEYLKTIGHTANVSAVESCIIFDVDYFRTGNNETISAQTHEYIETMCGPKRTPFYWTQQYNTDHKLIHFRSSEKNFRLLTHYYSMIHFTDPVYDNYYKRFVRDYLHYHDSIYCAAGKIVLALQLESLSRFGRVPRDAETGVGPYNAFHVRRGDLQYKKVKISAQEWFDNTKDIIYNDNEEYQQILYIATDERNKTFFDDLAKHYELRYLDDYWDLAELDSLDPNYMGMIDTIVSSRANIFVGTFFSTFTGYINRLRGYHGISMKQSYYSFLPKKNHTHTWTIVDDFVYAYEWPDGWIGIDANVRPKRDVF